jgi:processive 1,2-diacylglycerol beta-glucosyltransferase
VTAAASLRPAAAATAPGDPNCIVLFSASIGAGHDGIAGELARRLSVSGHPVQRHDFLDMLPPGWGDALRAAYARQLRSLPATWGWLLRAAAGPHASAAATGASTRAAAARMLAATAPGYAAVVSTYPLASGVLGRLRASGRLPVPVIAVLTDPSVHPLCVAPGVDLHLAPTARTAARIRALGGCAAVVRPLVGPAFRPAASEAEVRDAQRRLGLRQDGRLAVVVAGSWGVGDVAATVADIAAATAATPVVACGRNAVLRRRLAGSGRTVPLGWVDDMPSLLRAADVVVHNAGGLSSMEALQTGVPIASYRCLPGHGTANAAALAADDLSPWPGTVDALADTVRQALAGALAPAQRAAYVRLSAADDAAAVVAGLVRAQARPQVPA